METQHLRVTTVIVAPAIKLDLLQPTTAVTRVGPQSMLAGYTWPGRSTGRTVQERGPDLAHGIPPLRPSRRASSRLQVPLTLLLLATAFAALTPACSAFSQAALGQSDAATQNGHASLASTARIPVHHARADIQPKSLIDAVLFNQTALAFEKGIAVGPDPGDLEIRFATPLAGVSDHLRYRLLGFDTQWKDAGPDRAALYSHLPPGSYEFDFQQAASDGLTGSVVQTIPVSVLPPYWLTQRSKIIGIGLLLLLILVFYRLRVGSLVRRVRKLEQTVSLSKAELTLAATIAGETQEALKEQALKDALTGLWNRGALFAMLEREVYRAQRDRFPITLVMIDLDHFKSINDTFGHPIGDEVLREAAGRITQVMRPYDFAGRYGGEEFLIVLPSCPAHNGTCRAEDFRRVIAERPVATSRGLINVTCSLGVAAYDNLMPPEDLIHRADEALYRAKARGRNCVCAGV